MNGKGGTFSKDELIHFLNHISADPINYPEFQGFEFSAIIDRIKMKPMRSESGVTTVTLLTKPYACPGKCVFCPNDVRMPKSYIATEPGAQRALMNGFSPYSQVYNRLKALDAIGHPTSKIELLILGGTWSSYPDSYKRWFIYSALKAMEDFADQNTTEPLIKNNIEDIFEVDFNDEFQKKYPDVEYNHLLNKPEFLEWKNKYVVTDTDISWEVLEEIQNRNATSKIRCVGLVLETRSDEISPEEVLEMRRFGATKVQLGIQILNDEISEWNERKETIQDCSKAFELLRAGGFKIHAHLMPNLYKSTPDKDLDSYKMIFSDVRFKPDEMKIYPTSLIKNTKLDEFWREGKYLPYEIPVLINLIADMMEYTPEYCRITRVIRDIPSTEIEAGNTTTNLREYVELNLKKSNRKNDNIRSREIRNEKVKFEDLKLSQVKYETSNSNEIFFQYVTSDNKIAGFLRLSLPKSKSNLITSELDECAIIREVHVYGPSLAFSTNSPGVAQHLGLGTILLETAIKTAKESNFKKLAVISALGTRDYYTKRGFKLNKYYQIADLDSNN